jgi:uncharacterized integral membrane protein (TIGR00698 family)
MLHPWVDTALALVLGILLSLLLGTLAAKERPLQQQAADADFVVDWVSRPESGRGGADLQEHHLVIVDGIACTLLADISWAGQLRTDRNTTGLDLFRTAICGGSAIAALAPVLKAKNDETAVALATVFTLNSVALLLFPLVGYWLQLDQYTFGVWSGLAIHDTSSVVGAASRYGAEALAVGTTVKLTRAVWIAPVVMIVSLCSGSRQKAAIPLFIVGFAAAAAIRTALPGFDHCWGMLAAVAKQCLVVTLFMVGAGLSREVLKKVGVKPLLQGIMLWVLVSGLTLIALKYLGLV